MSLKLIKPTDYLLLIDEKAEVCRGQHQLLNNEVELIHEGHNYPYKGNRVIAYYPLTKEAKELDLPLLPNPFRDYSIDRAKEFAIDRYQDIFEKHPRGGKLTIDTLRDVIEVSVETGYRFAIKESQSKQFSLEDMKKAIEMAQEEYYNEGGYQGLEYEPEQIIQSLSTQQLPSEFIPEYNLMNKGYDKPEDYPYQECKVLKTITNSEGKEELVGAYKY